MTPIPPSRHHNRTQRGFTIVELLVVIAIISVLVGLVVPAVSGVQRSSRKTRELNNLKHVGHAWNVYAMNNADAALPGYLDTSVQGPQVMGVSRGWNVKYEFPDRTEIPPAPGFGASDPNIAGPWTWRLASYLGFVHEVLHGHHDEEDVMMGISSNLTEAEEIAYEPSFGYNGYYLGGWWEMEMIDTVATPRKKFWDHCGTNSPYAALSIPSSVAQVERSSQFVAFCAATKLSPGPPYYSYSNLRPDTPGAHLVAPPIVGTTQQWSPYEGAVGEGDPAGSVTVHENDAFVPLARHTRAIAVMYADGHVDTAGYNTLNEQSKWINSANKPVGGGPKYMHQVCTP